MVNKLDLCNLFFDFLPYFSTSLAEAPLVREAEASVRGKGAGVKEELCKAFCQDLEIVKVPAGLAVGTGFQKSDGDQIGFYIIGPDAAGRYRVQDDGATVPWLEACGVDLGLESGAPGLRQTLAEYGVSFDAETFEIISEPMARSAVPKAGLRLVAALLRLQDSDLMAHEPAGSRSGAVSKRGLEKAG